MKPVEIFLCPNEEKLKYLFLNIFCLRTHLLKSELVMSTNVLSILLLLSPLEYFQLAWPKYPR